MKRKMLLAVVISMLSLLASIAAMADAFQSEDELDIIGDDMKELCVDKKCSAIWLEPMEPEVTLETDDNEMSEDMSYDSEMLAAETNNADSSLSQAALDSCWNSWGDCTYVDTPDVEAIFCSIDLPEQWTAVAIGKVPGYQRIRMCYYDPDNSVWEIAGESDFGDTYKLYVEGSDAHENISIVRYAQSDVNCPMEAFTNRFDYTVSSSRVLRIRGNGGLDSIYGSQYGDSHLSGERVYGRQGNDKIYLDNDNVTYPYAYGGPGSDTITGTASDDYIWGDDEGTGVGEADTIYGLDGTDYLSGVYGCDLIIGGNGRDFLWGGDGEDALWPDLQNVNLNYVDTCYGNGGEINQCIQCEIYSNCLNSF